MTPYPAAEISPAEFEGMVGQILNLAWQGTSQYTVTVHDKITAADGAYDLDATVRSQQGGMEFVTVVEAKRHRHPIRRDLVQVLLQKVRSIGAHKGLMIATTTYQKGAIEYARAHGVALATVTLDRPPPWAGLTFVGPLSVIGGLPVFMVVWMKFL